ncbi:MAG: acyltransferase [Planctomycetes bacterium]|nr:acyltransferase [Planctomycetota bacterium]
MRAALTQTANVYRPMPSLERLEEIKEHLEEVRAQNVAHHLELARAARGLGAELICFGELFAGPYFALTQHPVWRGLAEDPLEGPSAREVRAAARALGMVIVAPLYELCAKTGKRFNTALVVDADGEPLGLFRKAHVPNGENEQGLFSEGFYYERSDGLGWQSERQLSSNPHFPVYQTAVGRIGVAICYDRHFEGVVSALARNGAQLVVSPAVTFGAKSERMWELEFAVDACRQRVFIGGSNRVGSEPPWDQPFFGRSHFVGPDGRAENLCSHPELVIADLDLDSLAGRDPSGWALARDRRPETYSG